METPFLKSGHHCFVERADGNFDEPWSSLVRHSLFTLESHKVLKVDLGALPYCPSDGTESQNLSSIDDLKAQTSKDQEGNHTFWLFRLKASLTTALAAVQESETETFCRRWSQERIYSPFMGREYVPPEVALKQCQDDAFQRLSRFFPHLRLLCQEACGTSRAVYILWERHEKMPF